VAALNFLYHGNREPVTPSGPVLASRASVAQSSCLAYLAEQVDIFIEQVPGVMPAYNWDRAMNSHRCSYAGEMILKGLPLSWKQVSPTLQEPEFCGKISAIELAAPAMKEWIKNPSWSVKPRSEWPRRFKRTKVRVRPGEYPDLIRGLYRHNIIDFLHDSELLYDSTGMPLVNGIFGVPKEDAAAVDFDQLKCILRLILNLTPSNEIQKIIAGEIRSLPLFSQWLLVELLKHECLAMSSEDMVAAFYLFALPRSWWPLFVIAEPVSESLAVELGIGARRWACVSVIPMGWISATGLMQHLHGQLIREARALVAPRCRLPWLSRSVHAAPSADLRFRRCLRRGATHQPSNCWGVHLHRQSRMADAATRRRVWKSTPW
jgi:hypothetical protein